MKIAYPAAIDREAERMLQVQGTEDHTGVIRVAGVVGQICRKA
jgi:hypothetical protein